MAGDKRAGFEGATVGDAVKPLAKFLRRPNFVSLLGQNEEGCLEGIVGVMGVASDSATNAQHHWAVVSDKSSKGGFVAAGEESAEKSSVRKFGRKFGRLIKRGEDGVD